jgi:ATP-binding cassette subfamily B protein
MRFLKLYGRVFALLGRDRRLAVGLGLANLAVAGLQFLDPVLFGRVIGLLSRSQSEAPRAFWQDAEKLLGTWAAVGALGIMINIAVVVLSERMAHRNRITAMGTFYAHVLSLPLAFHGASHSGRLIKIMMSGSDTLFGLYLSFFREQLAASLSVLVLLPLTVFLNWRLAIALIALVVLFVLVTLLVVSKTQQGQREVEEYNSTLAGTAQDALTNVVAVQAFTRAGAETKRFGEIARLVLAHQFPVLNWWAAMNVLTRAASTVAVIAIVVVGALLHAQGRAGVGEIVAFMGLATLLIGRLEGLVSFVSRLFLLAPQLDDFFGVLAAKSSVPELPGAPPLAPGPGEVVFDGVSFAYPGGPLILDDIGFTAEPGMAVALVGQTGAGKSTVVALLQRLWDPVRGAIRIDGQDIKEVTLESLHRAIGVVFQDSLLFNRSIRENLLIGRPEASEAEMIQACQLADAHEFIIRQPHGYDTMVGERGATLSGGQRQRLSIARAALKNPAILILDEATSALDAATEARVSRALRALMQGRTTFIIAHRLSTVRPTPGGS